MKKYKYYTLSQCMRDYTIQDLTNLKYDDLTEFNKKFCVVDRNLVIDYLEFRNLLEEYGIIGDSIKPQGFDFQQCQTEIKKIGAKDDKNNS